MISIGIDIAKRSHVLSAVDDEGNTIIELLKFSNAKQGFDALLTRLNAAGATPKNSLIGMEATGIYWVALFDFLTTRGYDVAVINPIQTDAFREVWSVRKVKTDAVDAAIIADLVRYKKFTPSAFGDETIEELRLLARYRMSLVERATEIKNQTTAILDRTFPELAGLFSGSYTPSHRALLEHCITPEQVLSTDIRTLTRILAEASRGRFGRKKAEELKQAARTSVGVSFGSGAFSLAAKQLIEQLNGIDEHIRQVEVELRALLDKTSGRWLLTIPGIDVVLASVIAGEIGDANAFADPHKLMAYAGMDPTKAESGETVRSDGHMSKRGPSALRWAFMQAADSVRRNDPYFEKYYNKKRGEDKKHHYVALSGVARKLMGVVLSLMKEQRAYEPAPPLHHQPGHLQMM